MDREWPEALVPRIQLFGEVLASVVARRTAERREHEAKAQATHAARVGAMGAFAASLAHELTQPLAASLANAETGVRLLAAAEPDLDELRATLADIVADERRAGDLVQKLRRFLRRGEVERGELDLRAALEEALQLVGREAQARDVRLGLEIAEALESRRPGGAAAGPAEPAVERHRRRGGRRPARPRGHGASRP
jgi:C4-dicarboxylate-specific signal transduction histidine kinase